MDRYVFWIKLIKLTVETSILGFKDSYKNYGSIFRTVSTSKSQNIFVHFSTTARFN